MNRGTIDRLLELTCDTTLDIQTWRVLIRILTEFADAIEALERQAEAITITLPGGSFEPVGDVTGFGSGRKAQFVGGGPEPALVDEALWNADKTTASKVRDMSYAAAVATNGGESDGPPAWVRGTRGAETTQTVPTRTTFRIVLSNEAVERLAKGEGVNIGRSTEGQDIEILSAAPLPPDTLAADAVALLAELESCGGEKNDSRCPICYGRYERETAECDHADDCKLAAILKRAEGV